MKRVRIELAGIAERKNLVSAFYKAACGKRYRSDVLAFSEKFDVSLQQLGNDIRNEKLPYGSYREFYIHDPKKRLIHAACFEDRVFHHAIMNLAGPVLERAMTPSTYACRPGKGVHRAAQKVQRNLRCFPWYGQIDIKGYFAAIHHGLLFLELLRRFKGKRFLCQLERLLSSYENSPERGLPIGSLTSQYFANYFLDGLDRFLDNDKRVAASIRYMDDIVWWSEDRNGTLGVLQDVCEYLQTQKKLEVKKNIQLQRSRQGISFCGFRILQGTIRMSRRRKKRYQARRQFWERLYQRESIDSVQLQNAYSAVHGITAGTESLHWRRENLLRHPSLVDA